MAIFDIHHPWAFTFGVLGNIISLFVYLAPVPTFIRICKEKSTMGFDLLPYSVALFSSMLWLYYAFIKKNVILVVSINSFGCVIETIYIAIYIFYASKKARRHAGKLLSLINVGLLGVIFVMTFFIFQNNHHVRVTVVGWVCVAISVAVFAAPLSIMFQVVRTRSVEFMPFPLSFFLTLSAVMWFAYGLFQKDLCIALPNVFGFLLGLLQMLLYGIYRNMKPHGADDHDHHPRIDQKTADEEEHVININMVPADEPAVVVVQNSDDDDDRILCNDDDDDKIVMKTITVHQQDNNESPAVLVV